MSACYVILAHVTWALAQEWALFIRAAKTVTLARTREWALAWDTTVTAVAALDTAPMAVTPLVDITVTIFLSIQELAHTLPFSMVMKSPLHNGL